MENKHSFQYYMKIVAYSNGFVNEIAHKINDIEKESGILINLFLPLTPFMVQFSAIW